MSQEAGSSAHIPVMADQIVRLLVTKLDGAYVDLTAGAGGHLRELSQVLSPSARLYGVDKDPEAVELTRRNLKDIEQKQTVVNASYADIDSVINEFEDKAFDGLLLDLGLSSLQLDDPGRGFSFQSDGRLDMRFNQQEMLTASDIVNEWDERNLADLIRRYGEERQAARIAAAIVRERQKELIESTSQLAAIVNQVARKPYQTKSLARVFQALRIAVNEELEALQQALPRIISVLKSGGRLAVISYHSLEDRIVKRCFRRESASCICPPGLPICICDHVASLVLVNRRVVTASDEEINRNSRARSARLRVVEKV